MKYNDLTKWFETDEGKKSLEDFCNKLAAEDKIKNEQLEKFHNRGNFKEFIEKVITKYSSEKYRISWYDRHIEPPEELYWFLFFYAEKYGRECNEKEWSEYSNTFTSALFYINGYYFNRMDGQGSVIKIEKEYNN